MPERKFIVDNLLVRIQCIIVIIRWTGLAPWKFEFSFPGSLTPTILYAGEVNVMFRQVCSTADGTCAPKSQLKGVPREHKILKGHLRRVIYYQVY